MDGRVSAPNSSGPLLAPSFETFFRQEASYVHRTLLRLGVAERDAEDGVQEVFMAVHRRWEQRDVTRPPRPWLFTFAFHHASNYRRLRRHAREPLAAEESGDAEPRSAENPERAYETKRARKLVLRALDVLSMEHRGVFVACDISGFSGPEVAEQLGIPPGTVYSRLRTARAAFAQEVRRLSLGGAS